MISGPDQTSILADEQQQPAAPSPVEFHSRRHVSLTVVAIEDRAGTIESLAKKAKDEGYHRISRELQADADMLREEVLPSIREQQEIPLAGVDEARSAIANYLRASLSAGLANKENEEVLVDRLAKRLEPLCEQSFRMGWSYGVTARENDPLVAIVRACQKAADGASAARG